MPGCQLWDCGTEDQVQASVAEPGEHSLDSQILLRCKPWRISGDSCGSTPPPACLVAWWGSRGDAREHEDHNQRVDLDDRWRYRRVSNIDKLFAEHNAETLTWINDETQKPWLCLCGVQQTRNHTHTLYTSLEKTVSQLDNPVNYYCPRWDLNMDSFKKAWSGGGLPPVKQALGHKRKLQSS